MQKYASVILPFQLDQYFTYAVPQELRQSIAPGKRVVVQFAKRRIYSALVIHLHNQKPENYTIKPILSVLDDEPVVNSIQLKFWQWIAAYYLCSLGEVFKAALPAGLKLESETHVIHNPDFDDFKLLSEKEIVLHHVLEKRNELSVKEINAIYDIKNALPVINSLLKKGAISIEEKLTDAYKPKIETFVRLHQRIVNQDQLKTVFDDLEKAPKQLETLMKYLQLTNFNLQHKPEIEKKKLLGINKNYAVINALVDKGILEYVKKEVDRIESPVIETIRAKTLNKDQKKALVQLEDHFQENNVCLLHGVTSSGKTEIYIYLIRDIIKKGKQVLYLLPEIALTTQIINRLKEAFGDVVSVYHSKFSDSERVEIWNKLAWGDKKNTAQVILGVRSSVFLPFDNLGLIIVDEEHENTYKQYDPAPRYNARDAAIYLAGLHQAKVLLGTATPSFDVYYNTITDRYKRVELSQRFLDIQLPEIILVDTRRAYKKRQMKSHFSKTLLDHIGNALQKNEQVILFQNRRGFSPYIECTSCGWIPKCNQCDVSLTYHKHFNNLSCHYCGYTIHMVKQCAACNSTEVHTRGFGTEKVEDEIKLFYPEARIARLDLDSTRKKQAYLKILGDFERGSIDILIGTQMVTKGLDFDNVSLVGILNADNMLNFPDFRAFERSYQLMSQVSGRAGRKKGRGKVIIQSSSPDHPVIKYVVNQEYKKFYNWQVSERKRFHYPPFTRIIRITVKNKDAADVNKNAKLLADALRKVFGKRVLGPEFPVIGRIQNWYLKNILIKIERDRSPVKAKEFIKSTVDVLRQNSEFKKATIVYDVDPL